MTHRIMVIPSMGDSVLSFRIPSRSFSVGRLTGVDGLWPGDTKDLGRSSSSSSGMLIGLSLRGGIVGGVFDLVIVSWRLLRCRLGEVTWWRWGETDICRRDDDDGRRDDWWRLDDCRSGDCRRRGGGDERWWFVVGVTRFWRRRDDERDEARRFRERDVDLRVSRRDLSSSRSVDEPDRPLDRDERLRWWRSDFDDFRDDFFSFLSDFFAFLTLSFNFFSLFLAFFNFSFNFFFSFRSLRCISNLWSFFRIFWRSCSSTMNWSSSSLSSSLLEEDELEDELES